MPDFQFYVTDEWKSVASLMLVQTKDIDAARDLATRLLADRNYITVAVWDGETHLFTVGAAGQLA